jgi:hypothetical protein
VSSYGVEKSLRELSAFADEVLKSESKKRLRETDAYKHVVWNRDMYGHEGAQNNRKILLREIRQARREKAGKYAAVGAGTGAGLGSAAGLVIGGPRGALAGAGLGALAGAYGGFDAALTRADYVGRKRAVKHPDYQVKKEDRPSSGRPSAGRIATGLAFPSVHPLVAGRKGRKLDAFGNVYIPTLGGSFAGNIAGSTLGRVAGRGKPAAVIGGAIAGSVAGSATGNLYGIRRNNRKGNYKAQQNFDN